MLHENGFAHLHLHTDFSLLDGYGQVEEYAERASRINQKFLCVSDHGAMGAIPRQIKACENHGLEPIYACELYYNPHQKELRTDVDRKRFLAELNDEEKKKFQKNYHLLAIAYNEQGYSNLVRLSSWAYIYGYGGRPARPRVNKEMLLRHKEGLYFTSCCYASEIGFTFETKGKDAAMDKVAEYIEMFGDKFRLEIMMLDFEKQKPYDIFIIEAHQKFGIPIVLSQDCHYARQSDSKMQRLMLMIQTGKTIQEVAKLQSQGADLFELQDSQLWMKSEEELNWMWENRYSDAIDKDIFINAKAETLVVANSAKGVKLDRSNKLPQLPNAESELWELSLKGFKWRNLPHKRKYTARMQEELELICRKGFASYFLIQKRMTDEARRVSRSLLGYGDGSEAVGPGRGSAVGSLTCYCLGITDVDPIKHDLLFSRFLSEARGGKSLKIRFSNVDPIPLEKTGYTGYNINAGQTWQDGI